MEFDHDVQLLGYLQPVLPFSICFGLLSTFDQLLVALSQLFNERDGICHFHHYLLWRTYQNQHEIPLFFCFEPELWIL